MEENQIIEVLESTGMSKNEIAIYLDLIRTGKSSAIDISKRTRIHRSNTYDILTNMLKKGIVNLSIDNEKRFFYPVNPESLLDFHRQKEIELKEIIPKLRGIQNIIKEERKVFTSEGVNSIKNILLHLLDSKEEIYTYGTGYEDMDTLGGFLKEYHRLRIKKKIFLKRIHGIESAKRIKELNRMKYTEARYMPAYDSKISTHISGNKVVIIFWEMPLSAIVIENKEVADTYQHRFRILWDDAKNVF